ncbi:hypothetical protein [Salana multivorans]
MDNNRYALLQSSTTARAATLVVGIASALMLTINGLRLGQVLPDLVALELLAPLGAGFGALAIAGILWNVRAKGPRSAALIALTGLAAIMGTIGLVVVEVASHYVLSSVGDGERANLLDGSLGAFFAGAAIFFLVAMLAFCSALLAGRAAPWPPVVLVALGAVLIGLRTLFPPTLAIAGVIVLGVGVALLAYAVTRARDGAARGPAAV